MAKHPPLPSREAANVSPPDRQEPPTVGILLCTFNGEAYLRPQLDSFIAQTHKTWRLFVSDDGSSDGTRELLKEYQAILGERMITFNGPQKGFAQNFMSLIRNPSIQSVYYAFSDQDDIWLPDKLERSLAALSNNDQRTPCLYCSRTKLIDSAGKVTGMAPLFNKSPDFKNALVQSLAGANTMVINESARKLLTKTGEHSTIIAHDWLTYLIVSGCGGVVVYDAEPTLLYRQHDANLIGANTGLQNRLRRVRNLLDGISKQWNEKNVLILNTYTSDLTPENRLTLRRFEQLRRSNLWSRLFLLRETKLYRQTLAGTLSLYAAAILNQL